MCHPLHKSVSATGFTLPLQFQIKGGWEGGGIKEGGADKFYRGRGLIRKGGLWYEEEIVRYLGKKIVVILFLIKTTMCTFKITL